MPYCWTTADRQAPTRELHLWPHQSLPPKGFAGFILGTSAMILIPLLSLLGTVLLWGILPFLILAISGVWLALTRSRRQAQILEILTLSGDSAHLVRHNPHGQPQEWRCNRYWATTRMHQENGPVPHYVTLRGAGREVEIGAFLSEDERIALYQDLSNALRPD